jgi:hypothetical protein
MKDDKRRFYVKNTAVGNYRQGALVGAKAFGPGAQMQRLLDLGAIEELTGDDLAMALEDPALEERNQPIQ